MQQAQECLLDAWTASDLGNGLMNDGIKACLGAAFAQGLVEWHGSSPQERGNEREPGRRTRRPGLRRNQPRSGSSGELKKGVGTHGSIPDDPRDRVFPKSQTLERAERFGGGRLHRPWRPGTPYLASVSPLGYDGGSEKQRPI